MPIGPYKNFAACVTAQQNKGHSAQSARKICGELEKRAKGEITETQMEHAIQTIKTEEWIAKNVLISTKKI